MPRKNKSGKGKDQKGADYTISYQPDWLKELRCSRKDKKGKQSTATIFRNPEKHRKEKKKPDKDVRTKVSSDEGVNFTVTVDDPKRAIKSIRVEYRVIKEAAAKGGSSGSKKKAAKRSNEVVVYTLEDEQPPPPPPPNGPTQPGDGDGG